MGERKRRKGKKKKEGTGWVNGGCKKRWRGCTCEEREGKREKEEREA